MLQSIIGASSIALLSAVSCKAKGRTSSNGNGNGNGNGKVKIVKVLERENRKQKNGGFGDKKKKEPLWQCVKQCGACCKLSKGPSFVTPEEIFENPSDIELYKSLVGTDGWCIHFDKSTRSCSIYDDRPYFCRVEPEVFQNLYGITERKFNKEACSFCKDTIKSIYGADSEELDRFNKAIRS